MRTSVYINNIENGVSLDFSASVAELACPESTYGFAFHKTLQHLGVDKMDPAGKPMMHSRLDISGNPTEAIQSASKLHRHIGLIARYAAQRSGSFNRHWEHKDISRKLGILANVVLPKLSSDTSLMYLAGQIVKPFASAVTPNNELSDVYFDRTRDSGVVDEDGVPLGRFSSKNIGGLEIGSDGLPAQLRYPVKVRVNEDEMTSLVQLCHKSNLSIADVINLNMHKILSKSEDAVIVDVPKKNNLSALISIDRKILENIDQDVASGKITEPSAIFRKAVRHAIDSLRIEI